MIDACHTKWECRSMEAELAQASAKLVEQQNEIDKLRKRVKHLEDVLTDQSWSREYDRTMGVDYNESY
jgi:uncharacterized coiled-coil protein SlyX